MGLNSANRAVSGRLPFAKKACHRLRGPQQPRPSNSRGKKAIGRSDAWKRPRIGGSAARQRSANWWALSPKPERAPWVVPRHFPLQAASPRGFEPSPPQGRDLNPLRKPTRAQEPARQANLQVAEADGWCAGRPTTQRVGELLVPSRVFSPPQRLPFGNSGRLRDGFSSKPKFR